MKNYVLNILRFLSLFFITACSYNISMAHTEGTADDVIDDEAANTPNIAPSLTIPAAPGSVIGK